MAELEFRDVSKSFGSFRVIRNLDLQINNGELFVLLGPSGCGKSTILRLIAGLEDVDSGEILIDGKVINRVAPRDRNVAMVFQNYALYPHMTIYDNLAFPLKVKKVPREQIDLSVKKQAELLGLSDLLDRKPRTLSGGQRQRVALGRALVRNPRVFLFDEPLSNLDAKLRVSTRTEIAHLKKTLSATMVYVTHDQEEALSLGDRIAILNDGILQQIGTPREIYNDPANVFCASFVGSPKINLLELDSDGNHYLSLAGEVNFSMPDNRLRDSLKSGKRHFLMGIRPENIGFERSHENDLEISVEIMHREFAGDRSIVYCRLGVSEIRVRCRDVMENSLTGITRIYLRLKECMLFDRETGNKIRGDM